MRWFCQSGDILTSGSLKLAKFVDFVELLELGLCTGLLLLLAIYCDYFFRLYSFWG